MTGSNIRRLPALVLLAALPTLATGATESDALSMEGFFASSRWTYQPSWSPDGRLVAYLQDDWATQNLFVVPADGGEPRRLSQATRFIGDPRTAPAGQAPVWVADSSGLIYVQDGDLKLARVDGSGVTDLTRTDSAESSPATSPDGRTLAFLREGKLCLLGLASGSLHEIVAPGLSITDFQWAPDGRGLAIAVVQQRPFTLLPAWLGSLLAFPFLQNLQADVGFAPVHEKGPITWLAATPLNEIPIGWHPGGEAVLVERTTDDFKQREILLVPVAGGAVDRLLQQRDERYLPLARAFARFVRGGRGLVYTSEETGWNHLYYFDLATRATSALTRGAFEVREATVAGEWLYFTSSEVSAAEPHVYRVSLGGGAPQRLTHAQGVHSTVRVDSLGRRLLYMRSSSRELPDIWVQPAVDPAPALRLTQSNPPVGLTSSWLEPRLVTYPGHDGLQVHAQLFLPSGAVTGPRRPAIIHTHQAASYQDVFVGPGHHKDNVVWYAWHQRLASLGYVVLNVDYRGSTGYGRDYRVANYRDLGGSDRLDAVYGVEYLKTLGLVDADRVGVYGMSYGGHLVLHLLARNPEVFRAGIDISGVADMRMVYETAGRAAVVARMSTPEREPELYRRSSALTWVDQLQAPVLILHGTDDPNVSLLQSLQLVDALLARSKRFEFEIYPGELHFFTRARSWIDAFGKMERFLERELVPHAARPSARR